MQLGCLSAECFPTSDRAAAMGLLTAAGRLGSITAQFVNSTLIEQSVAVLLFVTAGSMLCGSVLSAFLPKEPSNSKLED